MSRPEIERLFFSKRKRGLMFSPKEWMVVDQWLSDGIPFEVIEKGIEMAFSKCKIPLFKVNIYQCDSEIQRLWLWHKQNRKGAASRRTVVSGASENNAFIAEQLDKIAGHLRRKRDLPGQYVEFYGRMLEALVKIKNDIRPGVNLDTFTINNQVEKVFNDGWIMIREALESGIIDEARAKLESELKSMKPNMTPKAYRETIDASLDEELQDLLGFDKLNLFSLKL